MSIAGDHYIQSLYQQGDYQTLSQHLRRQRAAGSTVGSTPDVAIWSAICARAQGDLHAAYRFIAPLASHSPKNGEVQALLGKIADELQLPALQLQAWQAAVTADPLNSTYRNYLAAYHRQHGNPEMAEAVTAVLQQFSAPAAPTVPESAPGPPLPLPDNAVVVLIPVYADFASTQQCLQRVLQTRPLNSVPNHLLLINDASPDPEICTWLQGLADDDAVEQIELIEHQHNQGFIHTVNQGLARYPQHDAILLNADTLVHGNWLDRLHAAAYSADDIASVTPLSNFGELVSFPRPMHNNPFSDAGQLDRIDEIAAAVNQGEIVEIPVGVGFCFYLKHAALQETGTLNAEDYQRGYGEEADLCLRFRARGWRNVCAVNVMVGHEGNKSFKAEKAIRVAQNNQQLFRRYPLYEAEYQQFLQRDGLQQARRRIEEQLLAQSTAHYHVLVAPPAGLQHPAVQALRKQCAASGEALLCLWRDASEPGLVYRLITDELPGLASLRYRMPDDSAALVTAISGVIISQFTLGDSLPRPLEAHFDGVRHQPLPAAETSRVSSQLAERVVTVMPGPNPRQEYAAIQQVARLVARRRLPIRLWLQYKTANDLALQRLGCVDVSASGEMLAQNCHFQAGGASHVWSPAADACYDSDEKIEALINEW